MALTETTEYDKIKIVNTEYKFVQVRKTTVVKKDNVEVSGSKFYERYTLSPGSLDSSNNFVDTDLSSQPTQVTEICNAVWTNDVKAAWKAKLIADKPSE